MDPSLSNINPAVTNDPIKMDRILNVQSRLASANFDLDAFMNLVVTEVRDLTNAHTVIIELVEGEDMIYRAATEAAEPYLGLHLPIQGSISGLCVTSKQVLRSDDTEQDDRVNLEACRKVKARSLVVAPLFNRGQTVGVLKIMSDQVAAFKDEDVKILQLMAGFLGTALANQIIQELRGFL